MNDPKAWVRQWIAYTNTILLGIAMGVEMLTELKVPMWYVGIAAPTIGWFFVSREVEKWKAKKL